MKAKSLSLLAKIIGITVILGGFVLKSVGWWQCETDDLIKVGFSIMAICSTVDVNIMIDKFTQKKEVEE